MRTNASERRWSSRQILRKAEMGQRIPTMRTSGRGRSVWVAGKEATHGSFVGQNCGGKDIGRGYLRVACQDALGVLECAEPVIRLPGDASHFDEGCYRVSKGGHDSFGPLRLLWLYGEELQLDGVAHHFVACVVGMEMIARVVSGQEGVGMIWIPDRRLKVDDAIESAAGANPVIHGLANCFAVLGVVAGAMVRCQRAADDCYAMSVRTHDHLIKSSDKIGSRGAVGNAVQSANIIDAFEDE